MKSFEDIYEIIKNENYSDLEDFRLKEKKKIKIFYLCLLWAILINPLIFIFAGLTKNNYFTEKFLKIFFVEILIFFAIIILFILSSIFSYFFRKGKSTKKTFKKKSYNQLFKEKIISTLVSNYDSNLEFSYEKSISRDLYNQGLFEMYDIYSSNDLVHGKIAGIIDFKMGDVHTENVSTDSDGNSTYTTIFKGLFSSAKLDKSLNNTIKIRKNRGFVGRGLTRKSQLHMDSSEFEKCFDIYSSDQILAMRILTSDIMDYMVSFTKTNNIKFEITIANQELYIRIHCQNMFEGSVFKNSIDENTLKRYYTYLNFMCELNKKFYKVISEKDI